MYVYRLGIRPGEGDGEGEDHDEWFSSLEAAKRQRAKMIRLTPYENDLQYGSDYEIEKIELAALPPKTLALAILNRTGWTRSRKVVVESFVPTKSRPEEES